MTVPNEVQDVVVVFFKKYKCVIFIIAACIFVAYTSVFFLGKNNPIEIEAEKIIEVETGYRVDLTP